LSVQDQIYEWVKEFEPWKQELFLRASATPELDDSDIEAVAALLLGEAESGSGPREVRREDLPGAESGDLPMVIESLSELRSVNAIADGQSIDFEPGLNVVYGGNGAGKTGYSRILKHAGRTLRRESVLAHVSASGAPGPRATVNIKVGDKPIPVDLDLTDTGPAILGRICIADAEAGAIYLKSDTVVDYVPASLASISRLAEGLRLLDDNLREMVTKATPSALDLRVYAKGTTVQTLLERLDSSITEEQITALASLDEVESKKRDELRKKKAAIEASGVPNLRAAVQRDIRSADALAADLDRIARALSRERIEQITAAASERDQLDGAAKRAAADFAGEPLGGVGSDPWHKLWQAAREFAAHLDQELPPEHNPASCPLCMQELETEARGRLKRFDEFVRNDVNAKLGKAEARLKELQGTLPAIEPVLEHHHEAIERLGDGDGEPGALLGTWLEEAKKTEAALRALKFDAGPCEPPPNGLANWIAERRKEEADYATLENTEDQKRLRDELSELEDRTTLGERKQEILDHLAALHRIDQLEVARGKLGKTAVSRKITELSRELIQSNLQDALNRQLKALEFKGLRVEAKSKSPGGTPMVALQFETVDSVPLTAVLSQGEQRRLALAMFLAEMEVIADPSPVVFDDPVSSIDQEGRRHIARALINLARRKQVIVFTHELSIVFEIGRIAELEGTDPPHVQHLRRAASTVGHVIPDLPWRGLSYKKRTEALYAELKAAAELEEAGEEAAYELAAQTFCLHLREAIERAVEEGVFANVVTRRSDSVRPLDLKRVVWGKEICEVVEKGANETAPWAHDRPRGDGSSPPTLGEMREGLELFEELAKLIKEGRDRKQKPKRKPALKAVEVDAPAQLTVVEDPAGPVVSGEGPDA
jgi:ABC-type lipoprotein export system ATPase subunit